MASYSSNREVVFRIYTEFQKLNPKEASHPLDKWATELNRQFSKKKWPKLLGKSVHTHHGNVHENCTEVHLTLQN